MKLFTKIMSLCCMLTLLSCEDYLQVEQPSIYDDNNIYKEPGDFEYAINGCYSQLQNIYNMNWMEAIVSRCDEARNYREISRFLDTPLEAKWNTPWKSWWTLVFRCNQVLTRIENVTFSGGYTKKQKEELMGEAYAMRGLAYLQFAWCWGGSPLITEELPLKEVYKIKRSSMDDTYRQAISDFEKAFELLPDFTENSSGNIEIDESKLGRVTKYAAAGMLGRTYMYMRDYENAAKWLKIVIDREGKPYMMEENFKDCFSDANKNSGETVWAVQYMGGKTGKALGMSQKFSGWFIPSGLGAKNKKDFEIMGVNFSGASGSIRASWSFAKQEYCGFETGDKRIENTVVNGLYLDKTSPILDYYYVIKFLNCTKEVPSASDEFGNNIHILRYTDVKLMYAEALCKLDWENNKGTIVDILNEVRVRAGLEMKQSNEFTSEEQIFDYIVKDRFIEFAFEGIRWPDLIRWGMAEEAMEKHFEITDEGYNINTNVPLYRMKPHYKLAPIPFADIVTYNDPSIMWQNEGY